MLCCLVHLTHITTVAKNLCYIECVTKLLLFFIYMNGKLVTSSSALCVVGSDTCLAVNNVFLSVF